MFVALSSYSIVTIKRLRTKYLEQIRTDWFRLFFLSKVALFLWQTLKQCKVEAHFWDYSHCFKLCRYKLQLFI